MSSSASPYSGGPLAFAVTEMAFLAVFISVVLLVPRHAGAVRATSALALAALTYALREAFALWCSNLGWRTLAMAMFSIQFLSASDIVWISRLDLASITGGSAASKPPSWPAGAMQAVDLLWNARRVGTRWQVKNLPAVTSGSRASWLLWRLTVCLVAYLIVDLIASGPPADPAPTAAGKETLVGFGSLSREDRVFRLLVPAVFWFNTCLALTFEFGAIGILTVLVGLSSPINTPPPFGSVAEAYTLRGFWGKFWHLNFRRGFSSHADFVVDSVFQLRRGTLLSRYARLFFAFLLSGVVHLIADLTLGVPAHESGTLKFFLLQSLAIMLEDWVQALPALRSHPRLRRAIGYLWVAVFLLWSTPTWIYPDVRYGPKQGVMLPVRIVGPLLKKLKDA